MASYGQYPQQPYGGPPPGVMYPPQQGGMYPPQPPPQGYGQYPQPQYGQYPPPPTQMYPASYQSSMPQAVPVATYPSYGDETMKQPSHHPHHHTAHPQPPHQQVIVVESDDKDPYHSSHTSTPSNYIAQAEKAVRLGFIRKVYGILSVQLLITFGLVALFTFVDPIKDYVQSHIGLLYSAFILSFGFLIALSCCPNVAMRYPTNYLCLFGFTLTEGYLVGVISSFYGQNAVIKAVVCCALVTFALTLFAFQTKIDFTVYGGVLFVAVICLMLFGFLTAIFRSEVMQNLYAAIGALIFCAYIVYDTQLIIGGEHHAHKFTIDMYVFAALNLYIDIVQLFLYLLRLFGNNRS